MDHPEVAVGHRGAGGGEGWVEAARVPDLELHARVGDPTAQPGRLVVVARTGFSQNVGRPAATHNSMSSA